MGRSNKKRGRVTLDNANRRLPRALQTPTLPSVVFRQNVLALEDRRRWHPEGTRAPARSLFRSSSRLTAIDRDPRQVPRNKDRFASVRKFPSQTKAIVAFDVPRDVAICARRSMRREVLFARRKTGRGRPKQRRPRRNEYSSISCRRRR